MAEMKDKVVMPAVVATPSCSRARLRNCDYALTGSINAEGHKPIKWRLEPNRWTELPSEVISFLKLKFAEPRYTDVPNALPDDRGNYSMPSGSTRPEQQTQYVIEFAA